MHTVQRGAGSMIYIRHRFYIYTGVMLRLNLGLIGIGKGFGGVKIGRIGICIRRGGTYLRSAIIQEAGVNLRQDVSESES